jgi:hypothetical protein
MRVLTLKYPNQGDTTTIANTLGNGTFKNQNRSVDGGLGAMDFMLLELARFTCLLRKWSINKPITNENVLNLNPKIFKAILNKVREHLGTDGIF